MSQAQPKLHLSQLEEFLKGKTHMALDILMLIREEMVIKELKELICQDKTDGYIKADITGALDTIDEYLTEIDYAIKIKANPELLKLSHYANLT